VVLANFYRNESLAKLPRVIRGTLAFRKATVEYNVPWEICILRGCWGRLEKDVLFFTQKVAEDV